MERSLADRTARQVERLRTTSLRTIEADVTRKRRQWLAERDLSPGTGVATTPREAFDLLFRDYMGLPMQELHVVREDADEIAWLSENPCPTLEACVELGLDTRVVCRRAYEKPVQAFLSWLDPQLRFLRDYQEIRPYAPHCRERIVRVDFRGLMAVGLKEARLSLAEGNKGYGAVVAMPDGLLAQAHDTTVTERDPSLHAEFKAIRQAWVNKSGEDLSGAILVSTCEPCPMCSGLAVWANLSTIVYGASIAATAGMGKSRILVSAQEVADKSPSVLEVVSGICGQECEALYAPT